jgi:hypothetical protein
VSQWFNRTASLVQFQAVIIEQLDKEKALAFAIAKKLDSLLTKLMFGLVCQQKAIVS